MFKCKIYSITPFCSIKVSFQMFFILNQKGMMFLGTSASLFEYYNHAFKFQTNRKMLCLFLHYLHLLSPPKQS